MSEHASIIAVLDDEPQMRKALRRLLNVHGFEVIDYATGSEFLSTLESNPADCLVLDLHMPEVNGFDVLDVLADQHIKIPVVVITAHSEPGTAERVLALGAAAYLTKPVAELHLLSAIRAAMPHRRIANPL